MVGACGRRSGTGLRLCGLHGALGEGVSVGVTKISCFSEADLAMTEECTLRTSDNDRQPLRLGSNGDVCRIFSS